VLRRGRDTSVSVALARSSLIAFVPTADAERARGFYRDVLGLRLVEEDPFALVFDAKGTMLRVTPVEAVQPAPQTILGWDVENIVEEVDALVAAGVEFLRYEGMALDDRGIWEAPGGALVAWFRDPDGNVLSLTQF
jgi:catechol 2,3-dioxygenase-like lactoylglutathione lyase family enzyme